MEASSTALNGGAPPPPGAPPFMSLEALLPQPVVLDVTSEQLAALASSDTAAVGRGLEAEQDALLACDEDSDKHMDDVVEVLLAERDAQQPGPALLLAVPLSSSTGATRTASSYASCANTTHVVDAWMEAQLQAAQGTSRAATPPPPAAGHGTGVLGGSVRLGALGLGSFPEGWHGAAASHGAAAGGWAPLRSTPLPPMAVEAGLPDRGLVSMPTAGHAYGSPAATHRVGALPQPVAARAPPPLLRLHPWTAGHHGAGLPAPEPLRLREACALQHTTHGSGQEPPPPPPPLPSLHLLRAASREPSAAPANVPLPSQILLSGLGPANLSPVLHAHATLPRPVVAPPHGASSEAPATAPLALSMGHGTDRPTPVGSLVLPTVPSGGVAVHGTTLAAISSLRLPSAGAATACATAAAPEPSPPTLLAPPGGCPHDPRAACSACASAVASAITTASTVAPSLALAHSRGTSACTTRSTVLSSGNLLLSSSSHTSTSLAGSSSHHAAMQANPSLSQHGPLTLASHASAGSGAAAHHLRAAAAAPPGAGLGATLAAGEGARTVAAALRAAAQGRVAAGEAERAPNGGQEDGPEELAEQQGAARRAQAAGRQLQLQQQRKQEAVMELLVRGRAALFGGTAASSGHPQGAGNSSARVPGPVWEEACAAGDGDNGGGDAPQQRERSAGAQNVAPGAPPAGAAAVALLAAAGLAQAQLLAGGGAQGDGCSPGDALVGAVDASVSVDAGAVAAAAQQRGAKHASADGGALPPSGSPAAGTPQSSGAGSAMAGAVKPGAQQQQQPRQRSREAGRAAESLAEWDSASREAERAWEERQWQQRVSCWQQQQLDASLASNTPWPSAAGAHGAAPPLLVEPLHRQAYAELLERAQRVRFGEQRRREAEQQLLEGRGGGGGSAAGGAAGRGFFARLLCLVPGRRLDAELWAQAVQAVCLASQPFHEDEPLHWDLLVASLAALTGRGGPPPPRYGPHWGALGWQGNDPATDLRGCGVLGLLQLVALHDLDPDGAAAMWQLSRDAEQEFPLAIVSLAMTRHARQALVEGRLDGAAAQLPGGVWGALAAFHLGAMRAFDALWRQGRCTMAQSGAVMEQVAALCRRDAKAVLRLGRHLPATAA